MLFLLNRVLTEVAHRIYEGEWRSNVIWEEQNIQKQSREDQMRTSSWRCVWGVKRFKTEKVAGVSGKGGGLILISGAS